MVSGRIGEVVAATARGLSARAIAAELRLPMDLVEGMVDQARALNLLERAPTACGSCGGPEPSGCRGCPIFHTIPTGSP